MKEIDFKWTDDLVSELLSTSLNKLILGTQTSFYKKDIEDFKASHTPEAKGIDWIVMALLAEGMIIKRDNYKPVAKTFDELYLEDKYPIHSVLRYDGVIFSVDDNTDRGFVYSFEIAGNEMIATFKGNGGFSNINFLSKPLQRTPLFKTEDGVDVFHGDKVFMIVAANFHLQERIASYDRNWCALNDTCPLPNVPGLLYFNSKEKAEEYVILNKPCISAEEAIKIWEKDSYFPDSIKNLAKIKIKQQ